MGSTKEMLAKRAKAAQRLQEEAPELYAGFIELMKHYYKPGAFNRREKELMAVACSVATRCIPCLANHANNAIASGATRQQVLEAAAIGVEFGGGPAFTVVRDHLLDFLDDIEEARLPEATI